MEIIQQACLVINGFIELIMGKKIPVNWGSQAGVDLSRSIQLPMPKTGDAEEIALLTRLAVHETGHLKHTDVDAINRLSPAVLLPFNAMEDARIEARQQQQYPGAEVILNRGLDQMLQRILPAIRPEDAEKSAKVVLVTILARSMQALAPKEGFTKHLPVIEEMAAAVLDANDNVAISEAIDELGQANSSIDVERIAVELWQKLQEKNEPPQQEPNSGDSDDQANPVEAGSEEQGEKAEGGDQAKGPDDQNEPGDQASTDGPKHEGSGERQSGASQDDESTQDADRPSESAEPNGSEQTADVDDEAEAQNKVSGDLPAEDQQPVDDKGQTDSSQGQNGGEPGGESQKNGDQSCPGEQGNAQETVSSESCTESPQGSGNEASQSDSQSQNEPSPSSSPDETQSPDAEGATGEQSNSEPGQCDSDKSQAEVTGNATGGQSDDPGGNAAGGSLSWKNELDGGDGLDLGTLIRLAHQLQYGDPDQEQGQAAQECSPQQLEAIRLLLQDSDGESAEQLIEQAIEAVHLTLEPASENEEPVSETGIQIGGVFDAADKPPSTPNVFRLEGVQSHLVQVLRRELQEHRHRPVATARSGSTIKTEKFWRLGRLGDTKIFRAPQKRVGIDAAVTILIDQSGSMDEMLVDAAEIALAFSLALERLGHVKTSTLVFPGAKEITETIQAFGQSARSCLGKVQSLVACGGTPMGEAMKSALRQLTIQRNEKRLLVVITDGMPDRLRSVQEALREAIRDDVEVMGVGIGVNITGCIPNSLQVEKVGDLPSALAKHFANKLPQLLAA